MPAALAQKKENNKNRAKADPVGKCFLPGVPRLMYMPYPFQIVQVPGFVAVLSQYAHVVRNIPVNDRPHLPDIEFWLGDPRGHWDGDTLVVDVTNFNDMTWFDGAGNYSMGLQEQLVFPELNPDKFTRVQGMNITFVVNNASDDESREFLTHMGIPFQTDEKKK